MVHTIQLIAMLGAGQMQILSLIWISQCINGGICGFPKGQICGFPNGGIYEFPNGAIYGFPNGGICGFPNEIYMDFLMVKYMDFSMEYLDFLLAADVFRG